MSAPLEKPINPTRLRTIQRDGVRRITTVGMSRRPISDLYHYLLTISWARLMLMIILTYVALNCVFAVLYLLGGDTILGAAPGSFADAFFFSVQTLATIGYGVMAPKTAWSHGLVTVEAFTGMMTVAMATGLLFAKFAKPTARVLFSHTAVIAPRNGRLHLQFRAANQRANQIVEARLTVALARNETTLEGEAMRRFYDIQLVRNQNIIFALSWTAMHVIDENSPLWGYDSAKLSAQDAEIIVSLAGTDETMSQTVHARWSYVPEEILWNHRMLDIIGVLPTGERYIDYTKFHLTEPLPVAKLQSQGANTVETKVPSDAPPNP